MEAGKAMAEKDFTLAWIQRRRLEKKWLVCLWGLIADWNRIWPPHLGLPHCSRPPLAAENQPPPVYMSSPNLQFPSKISDLQMCPKIRYE